MSKSLVITIAGEGMRSQVPIATPNTSLYAVLSEFCKKNNEDPANYQLKKGAVDLQMPWRLAGIPNNATLEIERVKGGKKKTAGIVSIGLQLPDNKRIVGSYPTGTILWELLLQVESQNTINITKTGFLDKKAKKTFYQLPTVAYMNQAIKTLDELQKKTLSELGLRNGDNALLRVVYEVLDKTLEEMIPVLASYVPTQQQEPKTPKSATVPAQQQPEQTPVVQAEQQQQSPQDENMLATDDAIDAPAEDKMDIDEPQQQQAPPKEEKSHLFLPIEDDAVHIKLYKMVNPQFDPKELDIEESEFELTAAELKEYLASTEKKKEERETIKTEKFRVLDKQKQKKYPKALIRFRFPGGLIVQAAYNPSHTVAKLYTLIPKVMENAQTPFYLYIAPPVQRLDDCKEKTLGEMNLVPAAIVNVALDKKVAKPDDKDPAIHSQYLPLIQEANKEEIPKAISDTPAPEQDANKSSTNKQTSGGKKLGSTPTDSTDKKKKNIPKWLKPF